MRTLSGYFTTPLTVDAAKIGIRDGVARRDDAFLAVARTRFFHPDSAYRPLLEAAGTEYGDVEVAVRQRGLEAALRELYRAGVYLSYEECLTGEVRRGTKAWRFPTQALDNPRLSATVAVRSGGTRSRGTWIAMPLEYLAETHAPQLAITLETFAGPRAPVLSWQLGLPSAVGLMNWLSLAKIRRPPRAWFSLTPPRRRVRGGQYVLRTAFAIARRYGVGPPSPTYASVDDAGRVLDAVLRARDDAGECVMLTTPSCATRLSAESRRREVSLQGVVFLPGGEPLTSAKAEEITRTGARVAPRYSVTEAGGSVGAPCAAPEASDDVHFRSDVLAAITRPRNIGDATVESLVLTTLRADAPKFLLNVEIDDFALMAERACGCVWHQLGLRTHLCEIRSFSKLTGEGTTLLGTNVVHIIEQVLPARFGGSAVDYQLVEAEDAHALTRLFLLVSPRVGAVDEAAVLQAFIDALGATSERPRGGRRAILEQARAIQVRRLHPVPTPMGKLLPFYTLGGSALAGLSGHVQ